MTMGEIIVEIMRGEVDSPLDKAGIFKRAVHLAAHYLDDARRGGQPS